MHNCREQVYVLKRPYVDEFLQKMGELFECVLFTASLAKVLIVFSFRLFGIAKLVHVEFCVSIVEFDFIGAEFSIMVCASLSALCSFSGLHAIVFC